MKVKRTVTEEAANADTWGSGNGSGMLGEEGGQVVNAFVSLQITRNSLRASRGLLMPRPSSSP